MNLEDLLHCIDVMVEDGQSSNQIAKTLGVQKAFVNDAKKGIFDTVTLPIFRRV